MLYKWIKLLVLKYKLQLLQTGCRKKFNYVPYVIYVSNLVHFTSKFKTVIFTKLKRNYTEIFRAVVAASAAESVARRPLKSIRMDIDLNEPFVDEEAKKEEKAKG